MKLIMSHTARAAQDDFQNAALQSYHPGTRCGTRCTATSTILPVHPMALTAEQVVYSLLAVLVAHYVWLRILNSFRDASDVYLTQQLVVDTVRNPAESPIYKSNKLDYLSGLRLGLNIRYDHYKIRNGNMNDVWEIAMSSPKSTIDLYGLTITRGQLNDAVERVSELLAELGMEEVSMEQSELFFLENFVVFISCLVKQVPINVYGAGTTGEKGWVFSKGMFQKGTETIPLPFIPLELQDTTHFANPYDPSKDKGICLKWHYKLNPHVSATTNFTQANVISAIASTLKHLPADFTFDNSDRLLVVQDLFSMEHTLAHIVKILALFIYPTNVVVANPDSWTKLLALKPTILAIPLSKWKTLQPKLSPTEKMAAKIGSYFLSHGIYLPIRKGMRLTYVQSSLNNNASIQMKELNRYRALNSRLILEFGYHNIAGPVLATDLFDYRTLPFAIKSFGCLSQSLEYKLTNMDESNNGVINVRGFTIGKTAFSIQEDKAERNSDGFMPLNLKGKWGSDGCLYII